ncbi:MAG: BON domain-containing protein [Bdellovibrio sp.]|nr:BON domain-containing protein [Methylotenera sp.]
MTPSPIQKIVQFILAIGFTAQLSSCLPLVAGGAAAGGAVAADRRTSGYYVEDENIELKAVKKMETNLGEHAHVNVTSYNRNILLTGEVPDAAAKANAELLIKEIENVRTITNEIAVGPKTSLSSRSNDTYLTSKVKTKFVTENKFPANYVKIVTENSVVYLLGIVTKAEANDATAIASNTDGVDKVVKVFEYMQ